MILFPDGDGQVTGSHYYPVTGREKPEETEEEKRRRASGRASGKVHAMAKFHKLDHLWTITKRGGIETYKDASRIVGKFKRLALKEYPDLKAVFVPELHTGKGVNDGTWHIHFAVHGFYDVRVFREIVYNIFGVDEQGKPRGQINVSSAHIEGGSSLAVASYISAYISKNVFSESREKNQRYYFITRSCLIPSLKRIAGKVRTYGMGPVGRDYHGHTQERESRLLGYIFLKTGRFGRITWRSPDGLHFRMATWGAK